LLLAGHLRLATEWNTRRRWGTAMGVPALGLAIAALVSDLTEPSGGAPGRYATTLKPIGTGRRRAEQRRWPVTIHRRLLVGLEVLARAALACRGAGARSPPGTRTARGAGQQRRADLPCKEALDAIDV
jgi:hypothetical protein